MSQYIHIQELKDDFYYNINKHIFQEYEDKIIFFTVHNLPSFDNIKHILDNNILYEEKPSWVNEVYQRDYIQIENILYIYVGPFDILFVMLMKYQKMNYM